MSETASYTQISGVLEKILFSNGLNGYVVGELLTENSPVTITIVGTLLNTQCGETLMLEGQWVEHPKFGRQFQVERFQSKLPSHIHGIKKYLSSGLIKGIGKAYAEKIVAHFGIKTLDILSQSPELLIKVPGLGKKRCALIQKAWKDHHNVRELIVFLQTYGISIGQCLRIHRQYGNFAKQIIENHPYQLVQDIYGIGFKTADTLALNLGFANNHPERLQAGILYALSENETAGNTAITPEELRKLSVKLLAIKEEQLNPSFRTLLNHSRIAWYKEKQLIQSWFAAEAEISIAQHLLRLHSAQSALPPIQIDEELDKIRNTLPFSLISSQQDALRCLLTEKLSILTGGPGTGKTTILRSLIEILNLKNTPLLLAAPTGRAAQRMKESTGIPAQTLHRLLAFSPEKNQFLRNEESPLEVKCIIIDEASMLDVYLMASLLKAIPNSAHLILVGDANQLPSVGPGNVLSDISQSLFVKTVELNQIFRQQEDSSIVTAAHQILLGQTFLGQRGTPQLITQEHDFYFFDARTPEQCQEFIVDLCKNQLPKHFDFDILREVQILSPMNRGTSGVLNLNLTLQNELNAQTVVLGFPFKLGDKVIQTKNNYDKGIFNGDIGFVVKIDPEEFKIWVDFSGECVDYDRGEWYELSLAYAISVHKSQGSEFPVVIMPLLKQHFLLLQRNLVYTAITRAQQKVFLIGEVDAYAMAVRSKRNVARNTTLLSRLQGL